MHWWGWTNRGGSGAVKQDIDGRVIARHRDETWESDIENAIGIEKRLKEKERDRATHITAEPVTRKG